MNMCVNTVFASVPIIHTYTETAKEEMILNMQMGRRGGKVEIVV